ncbi:hypothetical protein BC835DRAFT_1263743 [Cytidiella melzeri]|nr:hypothetical protein BC835DRAFT_1263743 [Cytidiella melzeri]
MLRRSSVPAICVSPPPEDEPTAEPFSPFALTHPPTPVSDDDGFRPSLLSPPPLVSPRFPRQLSPLRPADAPVTGHGLEREKFQELLRASRERNCAMGGKKSIDLRKEIAIKAHKNKQAERRALFLSKIQAPPSPSAINTPKTPPESPAMFYFSFPSPGLESPLAVFEAMATEDPTRPHHPTWVEQVEFHLPDQKRPLPVRSSSLRQTKVPSLAQITAHYTPIGSAANAMQAAQTARLPGFLATRSAAAKPRTLPPAVGRLQFPVRTNSTPTLAESAKEIRAPVSRPPMSPCSPKLQVTTLVVPHTSFSSPTEFTESNLRAFDATRTDTAQVMMSRLRRRTLPPTTAEMLSAELRQDEEDKKVRRRSAPPELPFRERRGFTKPPLNVPGAF